MTLSMVQKIPVDEGVISCSVFESLGFPDSRQNITIWATTFNQRLICAPVQADVFVFVKTHTFLNRHYQL